MTPADEGAHRVGLALDGVAVVAIASPRTPAWQLVDYDNLLVLDNGTQYALGWLPADVRDVIRQALHDAQAARSA